MEKELKEKGTELLRQIMQDGLDYRSEQETKKK